MQQNTETAEQESVARASVDRRTELLDVKAVAEALSCSTRTVYRLADGGRMPRPVKLGALVRWRRDELLQWIEHGCPSCRKGGGA